MAVHVEGLRDTIRALQKAGVEAEEMKEAMSRIAAAATDIIRGNTPVGKTMRLRNSIRGNKAKGKAQVIAGGARVPYAGPINYGWRRRNIKPREFMQSADRVMETKAVQMLEDNLNEIVSRRVG